MVMKTGSSKFRTNQAQTLTVVGSGISGLMSAWKAANAGLVVTLISKSPDPRTVKDLTVNQQSSTFDSKNDQRYITIFEGHPYLALKGYVDKMYPGIAEDFQRAVLAGGLLALEPEEFSTRSINWLRERSSIDQELAAGNEDKIKEVQKLFASYANENRAAMADWFEILIQLLKEYPELIEDLSLSHKGILRLYDNNEVYEQAKASHISAGVFKKAFTPEELIVEYPAYSEGVKRGFIKGGALEMFGLTFGVKAVGQCLIRDLESRGIRIYFNTEVRRLDIDESQTVRGVHIAGRTSPVISDHYIFHTGPFAAPELFEKVPQAKDKLAAVEGYWITIENASALVRAMGGKPNKIHGKKTIADILTMVERESANRYRERFSEFGLELAQLSQIAPIVDFNNMPLRAGNMVSLGVGSGYIFKGLAESDPKLPGVMFAENVKSEQFTLTVMELWLEALHGKKLLRKGSRLIVHPTGCKRSWTADDRELDVNLPTASGGLCMIHDGGNTGSTTKSPFIAGYALRKIALTKRSEIPSTDALQELRESLGAKEEEIGPRQWRHLTQKLSRAVHKAQKSISSKRQNVVAESDIQTQLVVSDC
jgi:hypothetical protein